MTSSAASLAANVGRELPLLLLAVDYRSAPLELRERVAYGAADAREALRRLTGESAVDEAFLLSTCNRTELYLAARGEEEAAERGRQLIFAPRSSEVLADDHCRLLRAQDAVRHLLRVASGLESMVLGEPEILGQMKQASALAEEVGASRVHLKRLLRTAVAAGGRARAETAIGFGAVSLGYAVVELARSIFTRIEECSVLLLGAGEIATSVARALSERGARRLTIANRSAARAAHFLAEFPQADRVEFSERLAAIPDTDVVVATTAAEEPVLLRRDLESLGRRRSGRPLLLVDLGVPRNIDPEVGRLETVFLHNLDALDHLIQQNLRRRREEVPRVEAIIEEELARFLVWHRSLAAEPLIGQLQRQAEKIRRGEVEQVLRRFPAETHEELERLTRSLVKKLLHHPSTRLRAAEESDLARLDLVRDLFQLNPEEPEK